MADSADHAARYQEIDNEIALKNKINRYCKGPARCGICGLSNDRADAGYAVCSDCMEDMAEKDADADE